MPCLKSRLLPALLLTVLPLAALATQETQDRWRLSLTRSWYALARPNGSGSGVGVVLQPRLAGPISLDLSLSGVLHSDGDYPLSGAVLEGGFNLSQRWRPATLSAGLGLAGMVAGDDDGGSAGGLGPYAAGQVTIWPDRNIGITGRVGFYALPRELARRSLMLGVAFGW